MVVGGAYSQTAGNVELIWIKDKPSWQSYKKHIFMNVKDVFRGSLYYIYGGTELLNLS